jgi:phosphoribosylaminoimidazole (AIR) synthetase
MYRTFNMGIGFVMIVAERDAKHVLTSLKSSKGLKVGANGHSPKAYIIGRVVKGNKKVKLF